MSVKLSESPYTNEQVTTYLRAIGFTPLPTDLSEFDPSLRHLERLMWLHLLAFPYENLEMHYGKNHDMDISAQGVFKRLITEGKGFGTYCLGHNTIFKGMLQRLSYKLFANAARVNATYRSNPGTPDLIAASHMVLLVLTSSSDQLYLVDVGFGGIHGLSALFRPIPVIPDGVIVTGFAPPEEHRIEKGAHPRSSFERDEHHPPGWFLQARRCSDDAWRTLYLFDESEDFTEDFEFMNYVLSQMPNSPVYDLLMCVKTYETSAGDLARLSISPSGDEMARTIGLQRELVQKFNSEAERVEAIREHFGINPGPDAISHISGRKAALQL